MELGQPAQAELDEKTCSQLQIRNVGPERLKVYSSGGNCDGSCNVPIVDWLESMPSIETTQSPVQQRSFAGMSSRLPMHR